MRFAPISNQGRLIASVVIPGLLLATAGLPGLGGTSPLLPSSSTFGPAKQLMVYDGALLANNSDVSQPTSPIQIVWNASLGHLFISDQSGALVVVNPVTHRVIVSYWLGTELAGLDVDGVHGRVFVAERAADALAILNASSGALVANVSVGASPYGVVYDPVLDQVYVANSAGTTISVVNATTARVVASFSAGSEPTWLALAPGQHRLFVADWGGSCSNPLPPQVCSLDVLNTTNGALVANLSVPLTAGMAFDAADGDTYCPNPSNGSVTIVSASTARVVGSVRTGPIGGGEGPKSATVDPVNHWVYVVNQYAGNYTVINGSTNRMISSTVRNWATDIDSWVYAGATGHIYGVEAARHTPAVRAFATNDLSIVSTLPISATPWGMVYDAANGQVYVENDVYCSVDVFNAITAKHTSMTAASGGCGDRQPAVNPRNGTVFASTGEGLVMINATTGRQTRIADPNQPNILAYDPATQNLFGLDAWSALSVTNVSTNHFVRHVAFHGWTMSGVAYDPGNGVVYVPMTSGSSGSYVDRILEVNGHTGLPVGNLSIPASVGRATGPVVYDPMTGDLLVANSDTGTGTNGLLVIAASNGSFVGTISIGGQATFGAVFDPANGDVYLATQNATSGGNVVKVSPTSLKVLGNVAIPSSTISGVAVDGKTGLVWASAWETGKIFLIRP